MKQLFKSIAAFALVATLSASCSKDDATTTGGTTGTTEIGAPTLTIIAPTADLNLRFNDIVTINFTATPASGAKLKSVFVTKINAQDSAGKKVVYGDSTSSIADSTKITRTVSDSVKGFPGDKSIYTITITDNKGKSTVKTVAVNVKDLYVSGQFTLGTQANTGATFQNKFFGLNETATNTIEFFKSGVATTGPSTADSMTRARFFSNSNKIDFLVYFGANLTGLYSPDYDFGAGNGWSTELSFWTAPLNRTIFKNPVSTTITQSEFAAANFNVEPLIDAIDFTSDTQNFANNLQDQKVLAFKTAKGKGLILVVKAAVSNNSYATFEVKWKKN